MPLRKGSSCNKFRRNTIVKDEGGKPDTDAYRKMGNQDSRPRIWDHKWTQGPGPGEPKIFKRDPGHGHGTQFPYFISLEILVTFLPQLFYHYTTTGSLYTI